MVPSCFFSHSSNNNNNTISHEAPQSIISCIYQTNNLFNNNNNNSSPSLLTLTWSLSLSSHSLSLHSSPFLSTTLSLSPSSFSLFSPTSKSFSLHSSSHKLKLHWDFSRAKYTPNSPQPISSFYLAISLDANLHFFLGDLLHDFARRARTVALPDPSLRDEPTLLSRREHVFARRNSYVSRAEFLGSQREIAVELCGGVLKVAVDGEVKLVVKRLAWKFRGNERFFISGNAVDFFWDVFNWVKSDGGGGGGAGPGVFVFQIGEGGVWPEVIGAEAKLMKRCLSSSAAGIGSTPAAAAAFPAMSPAASSSSVLQWAEESSSDGGRSSCSSSSRSSGINGGFSLLMYAWRKD